MFATIGLVTLHTSPGVKTPVIGQLGPNQPIPVTGNVVIQDGWVWHQVAGPGELWIPERKLDGNRQLLEWRGPGTPPGQKRADAAVQAAKDEAKDTPSQPTTANTINEPTQTTTSSVPTVSEQTHSQSATSTVTSAGSATSSTDNNADDTKAIAPKAAGTKVLYITPAAARGINIRAKAGVDSPLIGIAKPDLPIRVLDPYDQGLSALSARGQWLRVRSSDGIEGYTAAWLYKVYDGPLPTETASTLPQAINQVARQDTTSQSSVAPIPPSPTTTTTVPQPTVANSSATNTASSNPSASTVPTTGAPTTVNQTNGDQTNAVDPTLGANSTVPDSVPTVVETSDSQSAHDDPMPGIPTFSASSGSPVAAAAAPDTSKTASEAGQAGTAGISDPNASDPKTESPTANTAQLGEKVYVTPTTAGVFIRDQASTSGKQLGKALMGQVFQLVDPANDRAKIGQNKQWIKIHTDQGVEGYSAAWYYKEANPKPSATPKTASTPTAPSEASTANIVGVNFDIRHPLGTPDPAHLGNIGWVRFGYDVSDGKGSLDYGETFNRYKPILEKYTSAGIKVLLVCTHQVYGEGAGYDWAHMDTGRWRDLADKYAAMMGHIVEQFVGTNLVHAYQIWNEQDAAAGARASVPIPPEDYGYLLGVTIEAIREVDKQVKIITGGHISGPDAGSAYAKTALAQLPSGVLPDGIAFHPYGRGPLVSEQKYRFFGSIDEDVNAYSAVLPNAPLWISEWGVLDSPNEPPAEISTYAQQFIQRLKTVHTGKFAAVCWYAWAQGMDNGFGIVDDNGNPRADLTDKYITL